jgi:hypothetical protein
MAAVMVGCKALQLLSVAVSTFLVPQTATEMYTSSFSTQIDYTPFSDSTLIYHHETNIHACLSAGTCVGYSLKIVSSYFGKMQK